MPVQPLLAVLYQDARCLVLNKPVGVAIQGGTSSAGVAWRRLLGGVSNSSELHCLALPAADTALVLQRLRLLLEHPSPCEPYTVWMLEPRAASS